MRTYLILNQGGSRLISGHYWSNRKEKNHFYIPDGISNHPRSSRTIWDFFIYVNTMMETKCYFNTVPDQYTATALTIIPCNRYFFVNFSKIFRASFIQVTSRSRSVKEKLSTNVTSSTGQKMKFSIKHFLRIAPLAKSMICDVIFHFS